MDEDLKHAVKELLLRLSDYYLEDHMISIVDVLTAPNLQAESYLSQVWIPEAKKLIADANKEPEPMDWKEYTKAIEDE